MNDERDRIPSDETLVRRTLEGDSTAFGALAERYRPTVYSIIVNRVSNPQDAEDETQETFLAAYSCLRDLSDPSRFREWLSRIASNRAATRLRRRHRRSEAPSETLPETAESVGSRYGLSALLIRESMRRALDSLTEAQRRPVLMRLADGYSYAEIASRLGLTLRATDKRIERGVKTLRKALVHAA